MARDPAGGHPEMTEPEVVGFRRCNWLDLGSVLNVHPTELVAEFHAGVRDRDSSKANSKAFSSWAVSRMQLTFTKTGKT